LNRLTIALLCVPALLAAGVVKHTVRTEPEDLRYSTWQGYDAVELASGILIPDPGRPALPEVPVTIAVPADARVSRVTVTAESTVELDGTFRIAPGQEPRPLSAESEPKQALPDPTVYGSDQLYPAELQGIYSTGKATGFRLLGVNVRPLQYRPASGKLLLHDRLNVTVEFEPGAAGVDHITSDQRERALEHLTRLVENPEDLDRFAPHSAPIDGLEIDYLVLTADELAPEFEPFCKYRTARGPRTEIRTVEWVDRNYPGRDLPERMRNLIRDYYENRGLSYVLLAGDNPLVPCRRIRVYVGQTRGDIPVDLYYADLDYSWDSNDNGLFGEMSDSVDFFSDVIVGRASVSNAAEARNFIAKVRAYENDPASDYIRRALLPSAWLWRSQGYHGKFMHDSIAGITPSNWTDVRLENPPSAFMVADSLDNGFAIFDPAGHGNESGIYDEDGTAIYTSGLARNQTNDRRFSIMTSLACTPGNFEAEDCIAEIAHNCVGGGCIAVMMNSRYGWGTPPSMGPSEKLCIRFYDFYLDREEYVLGQAHSHSREVYAGSARQNSLWRWCMTEFNLFGDPALDIWSNPPFGMDLSCRDTVIETGSQSLEVHVEGCDGPVESALVCAWKDGDVHVTARTDATGEATLEVHPNTVGTMTVTATCHNWLPDSQVVGVVQGVPEPHLVYSRSEVEDTGQAHPNGILEPGETGVLTVYIANAGAASAENASVILRSLSSSTTVTESTAVLGTIAAGDTVAGSGLKLAVRPDALPGSAVELQALVTAGSYSSELLFAVQLGYPGRVVADIDTGSCALTITARGGLGFDNHEERQGRGFRFPEYDTSSLNIASLCIAGSADYVVDRFYSTSETPLDEDWTMTESLYSQAPNWSSHQLLRGAFADAGHPDSKNVHVIQRALGSAEPGNDNFVILVYDVINRGADELTDLYCGILADFDVKATDRFHDLAYTCSDLRTSYMRNVNTNRFCGVIQLYPDLTSYQACIAHDRYVYPDSGLNEDMKYRALKGQLGDTCADRPYNWSVSVGTGPFDLAPDTGRQRVAFGFIAAEDSNDYLEACASCQEWFNLNVGVSEPAVGSRSGPARLSVHPNPFRRSATIRLAPGQNGLLHVTAYDAAGRHVADVYRGDSPANGRIDWYPNGLPAGVYLLRVGRAERSETIRVTLTR